MKTPLYTIGHGARKKEDFLRLLLENGIKYLADVRSIPFSRFHNQYNQKALDTYLAENGITYVFMGDLLGGRPKDESCYIEGKISYTIVKEKDFFRQGIERLKTAYSKEIPLAIMCSERNPAHCHRTRLIAEALAVENIEVAHIDENGGLKSHSEVMQEINGMDKKDLFTK